MSHSFHKIWVHALWSTKERLPLIDPRIENIIYTYLHSQFMDLGCPARIINGTSDHVHCLFLLNPQRSVADVIKQVKGSSSHYINSENLVPRKFAWQTGYAAFTVGQSGVDAVVEYIRNQSIHHHAKTFQQELDIILKLYGLASQDII